MAERDEFGDEGILASLMNKNGKRRMTPGLRRMLVIGGLVLLSVVLVSVVISALGSGGDENQDGAVPIIRAETDPYKVKPSEPGGMAVPNKDSTIFDSMKKTDGTTENLLEDKADEQSVVPATADTPLTPSPVTGGQVPPQDALANAPPQPVPPQPVAPVASQPVATTPGSVIDTLRADNAPEIGASPLPVPVGTRGTLADEPAPTMPITPSPAERAAAPPVAKPPAAAVTTGGTTYVQLASVRTEADIQKQWAGFKAKNPELSALSLKTQRVDLGDKGIFYRIQAGPLSDVDARSTCAAIKSRGGTCIVAK